TAGALGTERMGSGAVIGENGLVLTIGYLITEAESLWITTNGGVTVPGHVVGYDQETGFGLAQALQPMDAPPILRGRSGALAPRDPVILAGAGGLDHAIKAEIITRREFAGYWEYVLDEALFTAPAHPNWGGAALITSRGELAGIGSLLVQQVNEAGEVSGANMVVPIDLLEPIFEDLRTYGRRSGPARPWLGFLVQEVSQHLVISGIYDGCPAHAAGLRVGDVILEVDGERVSGLANLFRRIWSMGGAGVHVPMTVLRSQGQIEVDVHTTDRLSCLKSAQIH
ncbi:MAG: S1C family serine protease, partial [Gammaproteobacteria bacterium]|nr:S1C family serine protease [Gammaproteobacteria bacterium]